MKKGDIVLVPFPFSDLSGTKNRPAVILIETKEDVTIAFITTQMKWGSDYDILMYPNDYNGLKKSSLIRLNKLATIDKELIIGRLGSINESEMKLLNMNLYKIFQLSGNSDKSNSEMDLS